MVIEVEIIRSAQNATRIAPYGLIGRLTPPGAERSHTLSSAVATR
jgi:hypothetical protein